MLARDTLAFVESNVVSIAAAVEGAFTVPAVHGTLC
jgi:hypothetical protein